MYGMFVTLIRIVWFKKKKGKCFCFCFQFFSSSDWTFATTVPESSIGPVVKRFMKEINLFRQRHAVDSKSWFPSHPLSTNVVDKGWFYSNSMEVLMNEWIDWALMKYFFHSLCRMSLNNSYLMNYKVTFKS